VGGFVRGLKPPASLRWRRAGSARARKARAPASQSASAPLDLRAFDADEARLNGV
jgi:hypothetical protein